MTNSIVKKILSGKSITYEEEIKLNLSIQESNPGSTHLFMKNHKCTIAGDNTYRYFSNKINKEINGKSRVLDLGCGTGDLLEYLDINNKYYTGVDISEHEVNIAKTKYPSYDFVNQNFLNSNFKEKSFDLIISHMTFHMIKDTEDLLKKCKVILKNNGKFIALYRDMNFRDEILSSFMQVAFQHILTKYPKFSFSPANQNLKDDTYIEKVVKNNGFSNLKTESIEFTEVYDLKKISDFITNNYPLILMQDNDLSSIKEKIINNFPNKEYQISFKFKVIEIS